MEIILNEPLSQKANNIYMDGRSRWTSVTDVVFISPYQIVVAHRYACKLYYIQITESGGYTIVDTMILTNHNKPHPTEMLVNIETRLYVISYSAYMTIVDIIDNKLVQQSTIKMTPGCALYHGIEVHRNNIYLCPSNTNIGTGDDDRIVVWNTESKKVTNRVNLGNLIRIKDITFLGDDMIVMIGVHKFIGNNMLSPDHKSDGFIRLYTNEFVEMDTMEFKNIHFDSITSKDGIFYATVADKTGGYIYVGSTVDGKLSSIVKHEVQDFPHGITVYNDKLAYTSYATSAVYIADIANFA